MKHLLNRNKARALVHETLREFGVTHPRCPETWLLGLETLFASRLKVLALADLGNGKPPLPAHAVTKEETARAKSKPAPPTTRSKN